MSTKKIKMICWECGSERIVEWNANTQEWQVQNALDKGAFCGDCDELGRIEEEEVT